jgi:GTP1/Obg family GTP-binding protein
MDLKELRRMTLPKLRDFAKAETELKGVGGMHKEDLIKAVAEAKGIAYDESHKDVNAVHSVKHDIRELKKQKAGLLTSSRDPKKLKTVQRKIRRLKRLTRHLAHEAKTAQAAQAAAPAQPAGPAPTPPVAG